MKPRRLLRHTMIMMGALFIASASMADPASKTAPYPLTDNADLKEIVQDDTATLYVFHSVGDNGVATDKQDPVLVQMISANPDASQLALMSRKSIVNNTAFITAFKN